MHQITVKMGNTEYTVQADSHEAAMFFADGAMLAGAESVSIDGKVVGGSLEIVYADLLKGL